VLDTGVRRSIFVERDQLSGIQVHSRWNSGENEIVNIQRRQRQAFLKMIKEFLNYVETYGIWDEDNAARTVY
jgi:hypothetical protein